METFQIELKDSNKNIIDLNEQLQKANSRIKELEKESNAVNITKELNEAKLNLKNLQKELTEMQATISVQGDLVLRYQNFYF